MIGRRHHEAAGARWTGALPVVLASAGAILRVWQWWRDVPLWLDEAFLANSITQRNLYRLLAEPLDRAQSVPPGFLGALEMVTWIFGSSDQVLRLIPLAAGVGTAFVSVWVARGLFRRPLGQTTFVLIIGFSPALLYYSTELKPYAVDVLATVLSMGIVARHDGTRRSRRRLLLLGLIIPWFSLPGTLAITVAAAIVAWFSRVHRREHLLVAGAVAFVAVVAGLRSLTMAPRTEELHANWEGGFVPRDSSLPGWLADALLNVVHLTFRHVGVAGSSAQPEWRSAATLLFAMVVLAGLATLAREHGALLGFVLILVVAPLVGALAEEYPFRGRLVLFLVPVCAFATAALVESLARRSVATALVSVVALGAVFGTTLRGEYLPERGDVVAALEYARVNSSDGDVLVPSVWSEPAFTFYERSVETGLAVPGLRIDQNHDVEHFRTEVAPEVRERVWLLFTHRLVEGKAMVRNLTGDHVLVDRYEDADLGLYLLELADPAAAARRSP